VKPSSPVCATHWQVLTSLQCFALLVSFVCAILSGLTVNVSANGGPPSPPFNSSSTIPHPRFRNFSSTTMSSAPAPSDIVREAANEDSKASVEVTGDVEPFSAVAERGAKMKECSHFFCCSRRESPPTTPPPFLRAQARTGAVDYFGCFQHSLVCRSRDSSPRPKLFLPV